MKPVTPEFLTESKDKAAEVEYPVERIIYTDGSFRERRKDQFKKLRNPDGSYTMVNDGGTWLTPFPIIDLKWFELHKRDPLWLLHDAVIICFGFAPFYYGQFLESQKEENLDALEKVDNGFFVYRAALNEIKTHAHRLNEHEFSDGWGNKTYKIPPQKFIDWFAGLGIDTPVISTNTPIQLVDDLTPRLKELINVFRMRKAGKFPAKQLLVDHIAKSKTLKVSNEQADEVWFYTDPNGDGFIRKSGRPKGSKIKQRG